MGRTVLAVVLGAVVMWITIMVLEFISHALFPPAASLNPQDLQDLQRIIAQAPTGAMAMLVLAWGAGAFAGGFVAARLARKGPYIAAAVIALLVILGVYGMMVVVPEHPRWVSILGLLLPLPIAWLSARLAQAHRGRPAG